MGALAILSDHIKRNQQAFAARVAAEDAKAIMPMPYKGPGKTFVLLAERVAHLGGISEDNRIRAIAAMAILDRARHAKPDIMAAIREIARKG